MEEMPTSVLDRLDASGVALREKAGVLSDFVENVNDVSEEELRELFNPNNKPNVNSSLTRDQQLEEEKKGRNTKQAQAVFNGLNVTLGIAGIKTPVLMDELKEHIATALTLMSDVELENEEQAKIMAKMKIIDPTFTPEPRPKPAPNLPSRPPHPRLDTQPSLSASTEMQSGSYNILRVIDLCKDTLNKQNIIVNDQDSSEIRTLKHKDSGIAIVVNKNGSMNSESVNLAMTEEEVANKIFASFELMFAAREMAGSATDPSKLPPPPVDLKINQNNVNSAEDKAKAERINNIVKQKVAERLKDSKSKNDYTYDAKPIETPKAQENLTMTAAAKPKDSPQPTGAKPLAPKDSNSRRMGRK